eukprot:gnl/TRDRNA2_/TRDRNA2_72436_c1_seq2.p1 gnl/TRDRNA2_/TRDRNA2_72436_c1~~gnl/TRDRNA2_/TRDRNA2_72436_c1_seq2.p1  ORF type:complete len:293 (-),score=38.92 gnl/TRDRNA2_/TRDRNA2_72436_c1_seq2:82-960(-)
MYTVEQHLTCVKPRPKVSVEIPAQEGRMPSYSKNKLASASFSEQVEVTSVEESVLQKIMDVKFKGVNTSDLKGEMPTRLVLKGVRRIESSDMWHNVVQGRAFIKGKRPHACTRVSKCCGGDAKTSSALHQALSQPRMSGSELGHLAESMQGSVNEVLLWHGTTSEGAKGITKTGFDLKRVGTGTAHGLAMYGKGCYYAECSSKADEYARESPEGTDDGLCYLLLCRVVLGEALQMTAGGEGSHPFIRGIIDAGIYDSVVGSREASVGTYNEYIVYQDDQVYPEYCITCKRVF